MTIATTLPDRFSIITIAAPGAQSPAWNARLRWPSYGDEHVTLDHGARRGIWAAQLDAAVMRADRTVVLVAEGLGCHAASWWARLSPRSYVSRVAGALLFDPAEDGGGRRDAFASPAVALPFPSLVLAGDAATAPAAAIDGWGARLIDGHRQRAGEQRPWQTAQRLIGRVTARMIDRDVERVLALNPLARVADRP